MVHAVRRRGRSQTRILYWFRTPPGVKVGRAPLDEDTIHLIERHHPDIRFDWPQILGGEEEAPSSLPAPRPSREPLAELPRGPAAPRPPENSHAPRRAPRTVAQLDEAAMTDLREQYARVLRLIAIRIPDSPRRSQLNGEAERLNPDAWESAEAKQRGLDEYETVFASLRSAIGRRRRRRKPRAGDAPGPPVSTSEPAADGSTRPEDQADSRDAGSQTVEEDEEDNDDATGEPGPHE